MIKNIFLNLKGKTLNRKIVIIESDDWGSIRMPNKETYNRMLNKGIAVDKSVYCRLDTLESNSDIEYLLELMSSIKNCRGESPKLTANFVVCNPNFYKIRTNNFKEYFSETITETYSNNSLSSNVLNLIQDGTKERVISPQFHGKEHVNVPYWLDLLRNDKIFKFAFENNFWGLSKDVFPDMGKSIQATYHSTNDDYVKDSIRTGLNIFENIFGFRSKSFIPNNYIFPKHLLAFLSQQEIQVMQGMKYLLSPGADEFKLDKIRRKFFQDANGITHLIRNCQFEPSELNTRYNQTLNDISIAFVLNKPAIISTHRINFVGGISMRNRDQNLIEFKNLLKSIVKKWPEVKFLYSNELNLTNQELHE